MEFLVKKLIIHDNFTIQRIAKQANHVKKKTPANFWLSKCLNICVYMHILL